MGYTVGTMQGTESDSGHRERVFMLMCDSTGGGWVLLTLHWFAAEG